MRRQEAHTIQYGELAQLGERLVCNQEVTGSSPVFSSPFRLRAYGSRPEIVRPLVAKKYERRSLKSFSASQIARERAARKRNGALGPREATEPRLIFDN